MIKKSVLYPPIPKKLDPETRKWCEDITGVIRDLRQELVLDQPVAMRYTKDDAQAISDSTITKIEYDDIDYDDKGFYNTTDYQFVVPYNRPYYIHGSILTANVAWTADQILALYIYVNDTSTIRYRREVEANITAHMHLSVTDVLDLTKNDTVDIRFRHDRGSSTNLHTNVAYNFFSVHMI